MRKLYEATGGQPQRWESLGNLGAVKADAVGIAYAVEMNWLIISDGFHSVSLTEARPASGGNRTSKMETRAGAIDRASVGSGQEPRILTPRPTRLVLITM
jgi:hypothetical protein